MISKEEISESKRLLFSLEKRIEKIGKKQSSVIVNLSEQLKELIDDIESRQEREKSLWNPDISTKIKLAKKGVRLSKKLGYFEGNVVKAFESGSISKDIGKKFISITSRIKDNKMAIAKQEFEHFNKTIELSKEYEQSKEEIGKMERMLIKEQHRIEQLLTELSDLEQQTVDTEKAKKYQELSENLEKLEKIRTDYLSSLASMPIAELLKKMNTFKDKVPDLPGKEEVDQIMNFFSEYPELGKYDVRQICELFTYSEKKLSHVCPETTKFKRIILGNRKLFENLSDLKHTDFMAVDSEGALDFYAEKNEGAGKIIDQIKVLSKEKLSYKKEYEKKMEIEEKRRELSKYSEEGLKKELQEIESLLEFLNLPPEEKEEKGLISKISSFLKI